MSLPDSCLCFLPYSLLLLLTSCASLIPTTAFIEPIDILQPDYSNPDNWAALPEKEDMADLTPEAYLADEQSTAEVDVFYLYPTTYVGSKGEDQWNASLSDKTLNEKTDKGAVLHQASIFNGAGRVYAPRYRQAHYHAFFTEDTASASKAFKLAYDDVKRAFDYYLEHYNNGRPIIIVGHSQGTVHAKKLLTDYFDTTALRSQLVVAYLVGMPIPYSSFKNISVCETPDQTGCFCSWQSWQKGYYPRKHHSENNFAVTNPLIWTTGTDYADKSLNEGTVLKKFHKGLKKHITDAQVHQGILWINKPKFFGSFFIRFKNYHVADFNLFYASVRINAMHRVATFLKKK